MKFGLVYTWLYFTVLLRKGKVLEKITELVQMDDIVVDTDECASNPCQNGGSCSDEVNKFNCSCASGYEGATCQTGRLLFSTRRYHSHGRILIVFSSLLRRFLMNLFLSIFCEHWAVTP